SIVDGCFDWASPEWLEAHVVVGEPLQRLPWPDGFFDVVFTSEVLVHVPPNDLEPLLAELLRVCRWQVLHLEPAPTTSVLANPHGGVRNHNLLDAYRALGCRCEVLASAYPLQSPCRVLVSDERLPWTWPPALLELYGRLEMDLQPAVPRGSAGGP